MALIYTTGTINQPDAGSVGLAMVEKLRDDVVAHAAWDLVEEFTPASGAVRWYVFKCLASQSGLSKDFHVVIGRTLATGELRIALCEDYTAGSHTMAKYSCTSGTHLYDADGCAPGTYTLSTVVFPTSPTTVPKYHTWTPSGTSTKWWIIAADDGFTVAFNGASNGCFHLGKYTPLHQMAAILPIQLIELNNTVGVITRNPAVAGVNYSNQSLQIEAGGGTISLIPVPLGFQGDWRNNDKLQNNQRPVAEVGITIFTSATDYPQTGWALGKQNRMRMSKQSTPVGFAFGDAYALAGKLWVPWKPDDGRIFDTGVASS